MKFILAHDLARQRAAQAVKDAPAGMVVTIEEPKRNLEQNALLHAVIDDIAEQVTWHGQKYKPGVWKRLLVAAWLRESKEHPMLIPSLDGAGVDVIYEKTSTLSKAQCSSLVEWCFAFGAEQGVQFSQRAA